MQFHAAYVMRFENMQTPYFKILSIFCFVGILCHCKIFTSPVVNERYYVVQTIYGLSIEEFANNYNVYDYPLIIKLKIIQADTTYKGSVKLAKVGWLKIENYEKLHRKYYKIEPQKKKGTNELFFTKEQEKDKLKTLNSSLNMFKLYFSENCNEIFKNSKKLIKNVEKRKADKLRIKKQLIIQIFESELSYL